MTHKDRSLLIKTGGGLERAEHWYVFPAPIPSSRWVSVTNTVNKQRVDH
jgi:hypothetical protein